ncbi:MAG: hypothetical protein HN764_12985 [Gammaproteobacteria bacterium]|nr:hypothetical protein [Gammaproteobacteria bacterium]
MICTYRRSAQLFITLVLFLSISCLNVSSAESSPRDVFFYFIEKYVRYIQSETGEMNLDRFGFESFVFRTGAGEVNNPHIIIPEDKGKIDLKNGGRVFIFNDGSHDSQQALNNNYPDGSYYISFSTPHRKIQNQPLDISGTGKLSDYPPLPKVQLWQGGEKANPGNLDVNKDLTITWTPFNTARKDPNNILDDFILLLLEDCEENLLGTSGLPFTDEYLHAGDTTYTFQPGILLPDRAYTLEVEHLRITDTVISNDIPGLGVYASATKVEIQTTGEASVLSCEEQKQKG